MGLWEHRKHRLYRLSHDYELFYLLKKRKYNIDTENSYRGNLSSYTFTLDWHDKTHICPILAWITWVSYRSNSCSITLVFGSTKAKSSLQIHLFIGTFTATSMLNIGCMWVQGFAFDAVIIWKMYQSGCTHCSGVLFVIEEKIAVPFISTYTGCICLGLTNNSCWFQVQSTITFS